MTDTEFSYDGYGVGVSGYTRTGSVNQVIPAMPVAVIPQRGGVSENSISDFQVDRVLTVGRMSARAFGEYGPGASAWHSLLEIELKEGNILGQIRFDRLVLRLVADYPPGSTRPRFSALGSSVEGLRVRDRYVTVLLKPEVELGQRGRFPRSLISELKTEGPAMISGDTLTIPDVGRIRLAQLEARHDDVRLIMMQVELDLGEMRGEISLAAGNLGGSPLRAIQRPERAGEADAVRRNPEPEFDADEMDELLTELRSWAASHPAPGEPFMAFMGRVLTPVEFLMEVESGTRIGNAFLSFLLEHSRRTDEAPWKLLQRAVEANRP